MRYLAVLGRQPLLSVAELESLFSDVSVIKTRGDFGLAEFSAGDAANTATSGKTSSAAGDVAGGADVVAGEPSIARLGGTVKLARELSTFGKWTRPEEYLASLDIPHKYVIGVSDYSRGATARSAQGEALKIKRFLKKSGRSVRVLENKEPALSSATVFHNQLGEKPGHFELIKFEKRWFIGIGVQNINAYRDRDQKRPARDAKVGMLPPKLAQILINLCGPLPSGARILDPFCGTGVVLQEALLMGYRAYGTDASERMVGLARRNLAWIAANAQASGGYSSRQEPDGCGHPTPTARGLLGSVRELKFANTPSEACALATGDARDFTWEQPIDAVVCETYLGPPMSQPPAEIKLKTVKNDLIPLLYHTLRNLSRQIRPGTPVVMAIPAWLRENGRYEHLKILDEVESLGYNVIKHSNLSQDDLLYCRDGQIVAREIIVLRKK